jgi:5'-nucleotidase/UDP-sugar diphosphatase
MERVMRTIFALGFAALMVVAAGCQGPTTKPASSAHSGAMDVSPAVSSTPTYTAPSATALPPEPSAAPAVAPTAVAASGSSYTVKKGDTLFHIAKDKYGDGKQWTRIASANPGLSPSSLKVGQTLVIP